ncbi:hypothetical protein RSO41_16925 [Halomonas sp. I1]|uniref:hypothetical protein n=1 Tax=Halomonas sp. I1 TaxID=393536 RepID=UPI0028DF08D1|nr:hypothetical protein [Halomonas sp. I1]MDT8896333.1 hypothetical protein [Halomonas sp. I1]
MQDDDAMSDVADVEQRDYDAAMTMQDVEEVERQYTDPTAGMSRRVTMMSLTRSREEHIQAFAENPDVIQTMLDQVEAYRNELDMFTEFAAAAHERLRIAAAEYARRVDEDDAR